MSNKRILWGRIVHAFIKAGWSPPTPTRQITQRILADMEYIGQRKAHVKLELTVHEQRVLGLFASGYNAKEIAEMLGVKFSSIQTARKIILRKLGARSMPHAVALYYSGEDKL